MNKRYLLTLLVSVLTIALLSSCGNGTTKRVVSETPIKTEVLGLKLCSVSNGEAVRRAVSKATDKDFDCSSEKVGVHSSYCLTRPFGQEFYYGGESWHDINVYISKEGRIAEIGFNTSYGKLAQIQKQYDQLCQALSKKYGEGNKNNKQGHKNKFWTDNINTVGVTMGMVTSNSGARCAYCTLYYLNRELYKKVLESIQDI